jgi:predicted transcriptional regulator
MAEVQKEKKEEELKKEELKGQPEAKKEEKQEKKEEAVKNEEKAPRTEKDLKDTRISSLFKRKPLKVLLLLLQDKQWYPSLLARESGQSYVNTTKILASLESMDIVSSELTSKKRIINLTEKGEKIARALEEITKIL